MITDRTVATLVRGTYAYPSDHPVSWDRFTVESRTDIVGLVSRGPSICWGIKIIDGVAIACFRGSIGAYDWLTDLSAWAWPSSIGWLHYGFQAGTRRAAQELLTFADSRGAKDIIIGGHSLGAAHARLVAAWLVHMGRPPLACIGWGEPLSGFDKLRRWTRQIPHNRSYVNVDGNEHDSVTTVPLRFWIFRYLRAAEIVLVSNVSSTEHWGIFRLHHIQLYEPATPERVIC